MSDSIKLCSVTLECPNAGELVSMAKLRSPLVAS